MKDVDLALERLSKMSESAPAAPETPLGGVAAPSEGGDSGQAIQTPQNPNTGQIERIKEGGFPRRHIAALDGMKGPSLEKAQELEDLVKGKDCLIVLCGDRGPGKTQMATYWAQFFKYSAYFKAHDLVRSIRGEFSQDDKTRKASERAYAKATKRDYLVIDEFAELAGSDYERRTITNIIDHRYDNLKATVIVTNAPKAKLQDEVGSSIISRCSQIGGVIDCNWASYR
jgi:DNA replication protein DnaC